MKDKRELKFTEAIEKMREACILAIVAKEENNLNMMLEANEKQNKARAVISNLLWLGAPIKLDESVEGEYPNESL